MLKMRRISEFFLRTFCVFLRVRMEWLTNVLCDRYHVFFHHVDNFKSNFFLFVTAEGIAATKQIKAEAGAQDVLKEESEDEGAGGEEEG